MYKYIKEKLPSSFYGIVSQFVGPDRTQRIIKKQIFKPFPIIFLTRIWNSVPIDIRNF